MNKCIDTFLFLHDRRILFIVPVLGCVLALLLTQINKTLTIFPDKNSTFKITTYSDASENGATTITEPEIKDNRISFEYTLKKVNPYPYAGLFVSLMADSQFLDLSGYDYVSLELEAKNTQTFAVYLKAFIDGHTVLDQYFTHEFLQKEVPADTISSTYRINLDEFVHPEWWLEENKTTETKIGKPHFAKMISMQIQNGLFTPFDTPVRCTVHKIAFVRDNRIAFLLIGAVTLLYFFAYLFVYMNIQKKMKAKQTVISYKELIVENDTDKDMQRIMQSVAKNYADPEFTVEKLAREAGVSASRIPGMLKERFDMNFKQYLNIIRITEAKRLLRETDNQITTCAYNVGYNNIPHFNRTFKQLEGVSPKEYRKKMQEEKEA